MFSFYGAKQRLAKYYPEPIYSTIVEPFAGSAKYSLHGDRWQKQVFLYDIDHRIIAVWKYLINSTSKDILSLPVFGPGTCLDEFQLLQAERWFLGYMISAATRNPKKTATIKTNWNERKRESIAQNIHKVKHWQAEVCSFENIPTK